MVVHALCLGGSTSNIKHSFEACTLAFDVGSSKPVISLKRNELLHLMRRLAVPWVNRTCLDLCWHRAAMEVHHA